MDVIVFIDALGCTNDVRKKKMNTSSAIFIMIVW